MVIIGKSIIFLKIRCFLKANDRGLNLITIEMESSIIFRGGQILASNTWH